MASSPPAKQSNDDMMAELAQMRREFARSEKRLLEAIAARAHEEDSPATARAARPTGR